MNKVQKRRLLNVVRSLRESKTPFFTMHHFINGEEAATNESSAEFCGTPACALGHYGSRRDLQRVMKVATDSNGKPALLYRNNSGVSCDGPKIQEHFGITEDEADELFGGFGCREAKTPLKAAQYIERFVADQ